MSLRATVSMSWVNTVLAAAERLGAPRAVVLARAGLAASELQRERWPVDHITRLWRAAVAATGDPGFGLKTGAQVGPASVSAVGHLLQAAPSLRHAIALLQRYQRLVSDGGRFQLIAGARSGWLVYHPRQDTLAFSPHQIEAVLAAVMSCSRWLAGAARPPRRVQFSHAPLGPLAGYRAVFRCPVAFEQAFSGVALDNAMLDAPLPQANARLAQLHGQHAQAQLAALSAPAALAQELRSWLASRLADGLPARGEAAQALGLSERTLARRMRAQSLSYSALLDEARRDAALAAVAQGERPLMAIGQQLGFAEPSTFWRAFRRWTGATPAVWRARQQAG